MSNLDSESECTLRLLICESRPDFLLDIIELIETVDRHRPDTEEAFTSDEVLLTAVIDWTQTIGEAANAVSEVTRERHPEVPWRRVVDMRNSWRTATDTSILRSCGRSWCEISPDWRPRFAGSLLACLTRSESVRWAFLPNGASGVCIRRHVWDTVSRWPTMHDS